MVKWKPVTVEKWVISIVYGRMVCPMTDKVQYRSIFISDVHLGTNGSKAELLCQFLSHSQTEHLYLVGDIVDGWQLRKRWYWPESHEKAWQLFLSMAEQGTKLVYLPGNHDEDLRDLLGRQFLGLTMVDEIIHECADGRRLLILHGDQFDVVVKSAKWLAHLGDKAYVFLLWFNKFLELGRRRLRAPKKWSLSAYLKNKVKSAVAYIGGYEKALVQAARDRHVDGLVCGHIHKAEIRQIDKILYCNDGDWVESCTALVEHPDGRLEIVAWDEVNQITKSLKTA
jgi:UDP-2,3-diacylglucosamine pyrophosphatase LpxH